MPPGVRLSVRLIRALLAWLAVLGLFWGASRAEAYRFVVYADSPALKEEWPDKTFNREVLGFINTKIRNLRPQPDFVFFLGDMVTRGQTPDGRSTLPAWKTFMESTLKADGRPIKIYVAVGNRDLYGPNGWPPLFGLQSVFRKVFTEMPSNGPKGYDKLAYWFEHGQGEEKTFFAVLDTFGFKENCCNWDNGLDAAQLRWLEQQALAHKNTAKHKFALAHGPAFSPGQHPVDDSVKRRMWQVLEDNRFDIYFAGHEHLYSRGKNLDPVQKRVMQTITGTAGAPPDAPDKIKVDKTQWHIYCGYNFVVVDVEANSIQQAAYAVEETATGYRSRVQDNVVIKK